MGIRSLLGIALASVALAPALQSIPAWADGPQSAYEGGGTDPSFRDPSKPPPRPVRSYNVPPLPPGMRDEALQAPVPQPRVAQRALPAQSAYPTAAQPRQDAPVPERYEPPPVYGQAPAFGNGAAEYQRPVYMPQAYAAPPPQAVRYVPVYPQEEEVEDYPDQGVMQPVVTVVSPVPYPLYREEVSEGSFPRPYRDGPMIYQVGQ